MKAVKMESRIRLRSSASVVAGLTFLCSGSYLSSAEAASSNDLSDGKQKPRIEPEAGSGKEVQDITHARSLNDTRSLDKGSVPSGEEHILVTGSRMNILREPVGLGRMPEDVMHTPQTINVVPQALMEQQNVKSLDEALRNVPGITASVGEGEGGMSGDQFLIRGFQAQNDIYENG